MNWKSWPLQKTLLSSYDMPSECPFFKHYDVVVVVVFYDKF